MEPPIQGDEGSGLDRRTVIRRGAILGGALVWTAPAVQTIAGPAFATGSPIPACKVRLEGDVNDKVCENFDFAPQPPGCCDCIDGKRAMGFPTPLAIALCLGVGPDRCDPTGGTTTPC